MFLAVAVPAAAHWWGAAAPAPAGAADWTDCVETAPAALGAARRRALCARGAPANNS